MDFKGKRFHLKEYFAYGTHEEVAERIESLGGKVEYDDAFVDFDGLHFFEYDYLIIGSKSRNGEQPWNPLEAKSRYEEIYRENGKEIPILLESELDALAGRAPMTEQKLLNKRIAAEEADRQHNAVNSIRSIAFNVVEDGIVTLDEALDIKRAFNREVELKKDALLRPIWLQVSKLKKISSFESDEQERLLDALNRIIDPSWVTTGEVIDEIKGKTFCLTGDFSYGSRKSVQEYLVSLGGIAKSGVSQSVDYLIIGSKGSDDYAYGNYGSKAKKAMELQNQGHHIQIIHEREFSPLQ